MLAILVTVLYVRTAKYEFVGLDVGQYVTKNPQVLTGLTWNNIYWALTTNVASNWHPLTWLSHMLDVQLFGLNPGPPHLHNALLHTANTVLLFVAMRFMTGATWPCALVAAWFAIHPLRVESVAWIAERKDVLSAFFGILTIWAYAWYTRQRNWRRYLAVFVALGLGLLSKPMLVTLPFVLVLLDIWPLNPRVEKNIPRHSLTPIRSARTLFWKSRWNRLVLEKLPLLVLCLASSWTTIRAQKSGGAVSSIELLSIPWRLVTAAVAYVTYIAKTLWPVGLACFYPHPFTVAREQFTTWAWMAVGSGLLLAIVSLLVLLVWRRRPYMAVGWFWYLGMLVPVIGLFQVGGQSHADRYTYLPSIGLYIVIAWTLRDLVDRWAKLKWPTIIAASLSVTVLILVTWAQVGHWKDNVALYTRSLQVTERNYVGHSGLGHHYRDQGELTRAIKHLEQSVAFHPTSVELRLNLGRVYSMRASQLTRDNRSDEALKQWTKATEHYDQALFLNPRSVNVYNDPGVELAKHGMFDMSERYLIKALTITPDNDRVHANLGNLYLTQHKYVKALEYYESALALNPRNINVYINRGDLYRRQGNFTQAEQHFEHALRLNPYDPEAQEALKRLRDESNGSQ